MFRPVEVIRAEDQARFCRLEPQLDHAAVERQFPGAMWMLEDGGMVTARCSLWWADTPEYLGHQVGYVGHYAVTDPEAAPHLLRLACEELVQKGCTLAIGPIDGNTWQRYRFITERGSEPLVFLEPDNPDERPKQSTDFGFTPLADYYSAVTTGLTANDPRLEGTAERLRDAGITIHTLDPARRDEELRRAHALSLVSFRNNFLYTPIS